MSGQLPNPTFEITRARRLGYATGSVGSAALATVPPLLLLYYLTEICGVPPAIAGFGLFLPQLLDFVLSPTFGILSDRTKSRWGSRRPYMLIGSIASALATAALFSAPEKLGPDASLIYTAIAYCVVILASTFFALPHLAMAAELSDDVQTREQIVATRMAFVMVGILVSGALSRPLVDMFGGGRAGFALLSITLGLICGITMLISWRATRGAPILTKTESSEGLRVRLIEILSSRRFVVLSVAYIFQIIGASAGLGAWPYYADYILKDGNAVAWLFGTAMLTSIITLPFWPKITDRIGRPAGYLMAVLVATLGSFGAYLLGQSAPPQAGLIMCLALIGIGTAGLQFVPFAMITDYVNTHSQSGHVVAGSVVGFWITVEKIGFALGGLTLGLVLSNFGYKEANSAGISAVQSPDAIYGVALSATLVPAFCYCVSFIIMMLLPDWKLRTLFSGKRAQP